MGKRIGLGKRMGKKMAEDELDKRGKPTEQRKEERKENKPLVSFPTHSQSLQQYFILFLFFFF